MHDTIYPVTNTYMIIGLYTSIKPYTNQQSNNQVFLSIDYTYRYTWPLCHSQANRWCLLYILFSINKVQKSK